MEEFLLLLPSLPTTFSSERVVGKKKRIGSEGEREEELEREEMRYAIKSLKEKWRGWMGSQRQYGNMKGRR